tara:strand:+ start:10658 stop:11245 length:588 start_codon:yes stop_codon:yes gene_type:complete
MKTQLEIKKDNIRRANGSLERTTIGNKGKVATRVGLYEQCQTPRDTEGIYMGAPDGMEPEQMLDGDISFMELMDNNDMLASIEFDGGHDVTNSGKKECTCGNKEIGLDMGGEEFDLDMGDDEIGLDMGGEEFDLDMGDDEEDLEIFMMGESIEYKALTHKPTKDSWGNDYKSALTESKNIGNINSLMGRIRKVIR